MKKVALSSLVGLGLVLSAFVAPTMAGSEGPSEPVAVPEPGATMGFVALGAVGAGFVLRKKLMQK